MNNINRDTNTRYVQYTKQKYLQYTYDPNVPRNDDLNKGDSIAIKNQSGKYCYEGEITGLNMVTGGKVYVTVNGVRYDLKTVRKCYPAI